MKIGKCTYLHVGYIMILENSNKKLEEVASDQNEKKKSGIRNSRGRETNAEEAN